MRGGAMDGSACLRISCFTCSHHYEVDDYDLCAADGVARKHDLVVFQEGMEPKDACEHYERDDG